MSCVTWSIAADDEFLSLRALDLEPTPGAVADVGAVGTLGDDAFVAALADGVEHPFALVDDVAGELQAVVRAARAQQGLKSRLALEERLVRQIFTIEFKQIEGVELEGHTRGNAGFQHG